MTELAANFLNMIDSVLASKNYQALIEPLTKIWTMYSSANPIIQSVVNAAVVSKITPATLNGPKEIVTTTGSVGVKALVVFLVAIGTVFMLKSDQFQNMDTDDVTLQITKVLEKLKITDLFKFVVNVLLAIIRTTLQVIIHTQDGTLIKHFKKAMIAIKKQIEKSIRYVQDGVWTDVYDPDAVVDSNDPDTVFDSDDDDVVPYDSFLKHVAENMYYERVRDFFGDIFNRLNATRHSDVRKLSTPIQTDILTLEGDYLTKSPSPIDKKDEL